MFQCCCASIQENCQAGKAGATTTLAPAPPSECDAYFSTNQVIAAYTKHIQPSIQNAAVSTVTFSSCESPQTWVSYSDSMLTCCSQPAPAAWFHRPAGLSTSLQGCLPACTSVYQPAPVSTNMQGCPPTCMGVHQPAKQDGYMAIYGQLDSRCTDRPQAQTEQTCSVYLNTQEEDAAVILQRSKAPAKTKLLCRLMTKVTIPACIPLYQLPRAAQFGLFFVQPRSGSSKSLKVWSLETLMLLDGLPQLCVLLSSWQAPCSAFAVAFTTGQAPTHS